MRLIWTLVKVAIGLAIAIPLGIFALALIGGVVGIVARLVFVAIRLSVLGVLAYVGYRIFRRVMGGPRKQQVSDISTLPPVDPYYQAAMRELDAEIRTRP